MRGRVRGHAVAAATLAITMTAPAMAGAEPGAAPGAAGDGPDLAVTDAHIGAGPRVAGRIADVNSGTIEGSWTSGTITGDSRVGGTAGNSSGVIRDSYSRATVAADNGETGGVVGVALSGSTTERVYAAGDVNSGTNNAGSLAGYGYSGTTIRDSIALNSSVTAERSAHALVGRYSSGTPTLEGNYAREDMEVGPESYTMDPAPDNPRGGQVSQELARPTLQGAPEDGDA